MTGKNIRDAYNEITPDEESRKRMLKRILSAASEAPPAGKDTTMKQWKKKPVLITAIVCLMVLLMGCAVVLFTLQDLQIGEYTYTQPRHFDENGEKVPETEVTRDVISLQGIKGSPSQQAAMEWYEFEQSYDADYKLLNEADANPMNIPREYDAYFVYTQEMIDKIDEICEKYGLEPAGAFAGAEDFQMDIFFDALGLENLHREDVNALVEYAFGYFYACGNFEMEFYLTLEDAEAQWPYEILTSMRYCGKGYLDTVFSYISSTEDYEQWPYTLSDGTEVLIIRGDDSARIFCDKEEAFLSVSFETIYEEESGTISRMTDRDVELVAETMDFSVVPRKPDMDDVEKKLEESFEEHKAEQEARMETETWEDPLAYDTYEDRITYILENSVSPENYYFALLDVNGDGAEELLLGREDSFGTIRTMRDGKAYTLLSFGMDFGSYLCQDNIVMHNDSVGNPNYYAFYKLDGYEAKPIEQVGYDEWEEQWFREKNGEITYVTEEEAKDIIASYGRIEVEMTPISEYPFD